MYVTPTPVYPGNNPSVINLHLLGKWVFFALLVIILLGLLLKIIMDFRRLHYKE